jgi:hypothetical protein
MPPAQLPSPWLPRQARRDRADHRDDQAVSARRSDPGPGNRMTEDEATWPEASNSAYPAATAPSPRSSGRVAHPDLSTVLKDTDLAYLHAEAASFLRISWAQVIGNLPPGCGDQGDKSLDRWSSPASARPVPADLSEAPGGARVRRLPTVGQVELLDKRLLPGCCCPQPTPLFPAPLAAVTAPGSSAAFRKALRGGRASPPIRQGG